MPPVAQRIFSTGNVTATVYTLATEIQGAVLNVTDYSADAVVHLTGLLIVTTGVGATTFTPRLRRGGVAGTLVGAAPAITTPASTTVVIPIAFDDNPGDVASQAYTLTGTAAGVAATGVLAYLQAIVG